MAAISLTESEEHQDGGHMDSYNEYYFHHNLVSLKITMNYPSKFFLAHFYPTAFSFVFFMSFQFNQAKVLYNIGVYFIILYPFNVRVLLAEFIYTDKHNGSSKDFAADKCYKLLPTASNTS